MSSGVRVTGDHRRAGSVRRVGALAVRPDADTSARRKARGAFFTPATMAGYLAEWAVRSATDSVFEPSCGEAAFLLAAGDRLRRLGRGPERLDQLAGIELHDPSATRAAFSLTEADLKALVQIGNFLALPASPAYDAVIGNPPYVRYQDFTGVARAEAQALAGRSGVRLTGLASSWAAFVVHAAGFVRRPAGRLGLVLPAELLSVNYASDVRRYLLERFGQVRLVLFDELVFPGVSEEVVLLLAEGEGPAPAVQFVQARNLDDVTKATRVTSWSPPRPDDKWLGGLIHPSADRVYRAELEDGRFSGLREWGETFLGMVTGNNQFFTLTPVAAEASGLDETELLPISPPGSAHLRGLHLTTKEWAELGHAGRPTYLLYPRLDPSPAATRLIRAGVEAGVDQAYKCRVRMPWWRVPLVAVPDLFLTCMNHDTPRLSTNRAGVRHLNSVHGVTLKPELRALGTRLLPLAALNSMTLLGAELVGRSYGGGLLKIEPREADNLPVPSPATVASAAAELGAQRSRLARALRSNDVVGAAEIIDQVILIDHLGLSRRKVDELRRARQALFARRLARGGRPRGPS
jgi:adenine-specific DNA-methyltransferase